MRTRQFQSVRLALVLVAVLGVVGPRVHAASPEPSLAKDSSRTADKSMYAFATMPAAIATRSISPTTTSSCRSWMSRPLPDTRSHYDSPEVVPRIR